MPRSVNSVASRARRKRALKMAKGYFGKKKNVWTVAKNQIEKSLAHAYVGRKQKKRDYRSLWIVRINAALRGLAQRGGLRPQLVDVPWVFFSVHNSVGYSTRLSCVPHRRLYQAGSGPHKSQLFRIVACVKLDANKLRLFASVLAIAYFFFNCWCWSTAHGKL